MAGSSAAAIGDRFEKLALEHLLSNGLKVIAANYRCRFGEIDIVMLDRDCVVFVEVRYRQQNRFATAAASIDRIKQRKLTRAAAVFLARNPQYSDSPMRFDVVAIDAAPDDRCKLQWLKDAFRVDG